jgi:isopenicillin N synthase-like dioxygenase
VLGAWQSLSKRQKLALAPLAANWHELTAQQRQKWLALSRNFFELSDEEQLTLHSRMQEWAALSPRQRSQARFHFNAMPSLSAQDKRAQWEAYQALSEQEKNKLSSGPKPPVKSAARSFAPPSSRLVSPPLLPVNATRAIQRVAPSKPIHPKTLLPQPS